MIRNEKLKLFGQRDRDRTHVDWRLFDLSRDESEINDVIREHPAIAAEMIDDWDRFDADVGIVSGYDEYFSAKQDK